MNLAIKKLGKITLTSSGSVIKAEDYQVLVEARKLLDEVRCQADILYRQREEDAMQAVEERARRSVAEQMLNVSTASIEYLSRVEKRLTGIVIESVERIIGELEDTEATAKMIKTALYQMRNENRITLRVSLDEASAIKERIREITSNYPNIDYVDVVADQTIAPGACRLESTLGSVSTGIDSQLSALKEALLKNFARKSE